MGAVPTVDVNGTRLYYERAGTGPRLLFLNGSGATLATSRPLVEAFTGGFDVVAHDQRGLGRSRLAPGPYAMADYAEDALGLLDRVGWPTCRVVGISFGGMVAQEVAVTAPARVERLALVCTSPGGAGGSSYPLHELAELSDTARAQVWRRLLDTRFTDAWLADHPDDRALLDMLGARHAGAESEAVRRGERDQLEARRGHDVWDRLGRIACPTLVAGGRFDALAPPANSQALAGRIPGAALRLYEGGHAFLAQDRRALPDVLAFLAA